MGVTNSGRLKFICEKYSINSEISLNSFGSGMIHAFDDIDTDGTLKPYRMWLRLSTSQLEIRAGLQKINFGSAALLRPLMWFDRIDPRDPLQLTDGVYGLALPRRRWRNRGDQHKLGICCGRCEPEAMIHLGHVMAVGYEALGGNSPLRNQFEEGAQMRITRDLQVRLHAPGSRCCFCRRGSGDLKAHFFVRIWIRGMGPADWAGWTQECTIGEP